VIGAVLGEVKVQTKCRVREVVASAFVTSVHIPLGGDPVADRVEKVPPTWKTTLKAKSEHHQEFAIRFQKSAKQG
jgi:hypothetical protein